MKNFVAVFLLTILFKPMNDTTSRFFQRYNELERSDSLINKTSDNLYLRLRLSPWIILTTTYSEYALDGYNLDVVDYLLKPIRFERFLQTINKSTRLIEQRTNNNFQDEKKIIFVKSGYKSVKIHLKNILYFEGLKKYVTIYTNFQKVLNPESQKNL